LLQKLYKAQSSSDQHGVLSIDKFRLLVPLHRDGRLYALVLQER